MQITLEAEILSEGPTSMTVRMMTVLGEQLLVVSRDIVKWKSNRTINLYDRFWSKVEKTDSCWNWTGAVRGSGYGVISVNNGKKSDAAHRLSFEMEYGQIPTGILVLHKCDNRLCVRPDHLRLGTHMDNMDDMVSKGRQFKGAERSMMFRGTHHSKLSEKDVLEIRSRRKSGEPLSSIAKAFNIYPTHVSRIFQRKFWAHL